jgi:HAE1 family hydrophobic/amphiphilic exporter-1
MYDIYSNLNGRPSAVFVLKQSFGSNANQVISDLKAKLEVIEKSLKGIMRYLMMYLNFRCFNRKSNSYASRSFYFSRLSRFSFPRRLEINCDTGNCGSCVISRNVHVHATFDISLNLITLFALVLAIG